MAARHRFMEETEPLYANPDLEEHKAAWDAFKTTPRQPTVGSEVKRTYIDFGTKCLKVVTIIIVFLVVLGGAVVSKGTLLFMTSQIKKNITRPCCNRNIDRNLQYVVSIPEVERVTWIWLLMFAYFVPEFATWFRSARKSIFKLWKMEEIHFWDVVSLFVTEMCPAIGSAILVYVVLPELDAVKGAMLTNAVCFVPGIISMFSRNPASVEDNFKMILDIISIVAQASSFVVWPLVEDNPKLYMIPLSVILISLGWWENFVSEDSPLLLIQYLGKKKMEFKTKTYFLYCFIAPLKCLLFFCTTLVIFQVSEGRIDFLFDEFSRSFEDHNINVTEILPILPPLYDNAIASGRYPIITTSVWTGVWVWLINIAATYICYAFGKFSCKVMIQGVSYAFPVNLAVPVLLSGLIAMSGMYLRDECSFVNTIPSYLFFVPPPLDFLQDFITHNQAWIWLVWLLSQAWLSIHIWTPNCKKLDSTEKLFVRPMYDAFLIDQSLALNRRRHKVPEKTQIDDEVRIKELPQETPSSLNSITRVYACGTMWHENKPEMMEFLKSVLRLDQDQCAHRIVRNTLGYQHDSYYELETHIFFDDAFVRMHINDNDPHVNSYVENLVETLDEAVVNVHGTNTAKIRPPRIYPTPYGGRIVWTLPGKTKLIAHLKDKKKIRAKKRWSQVMYMYYLLGFRLSAAEDINDFLKDLRAENTFILALDGDIDFQPEALHLLIDYMKKNKTLGAACGRIHPIGSGGMVWYQMFEYAVGHWLQKATEHVIGCVLCSPGCFSLFRGKALADDGVMHKYTTRSTEASHYVQYDQGEDRWLCTLLLQCGYRVEYSAASDAFTHCPEGFNEFYNQRRRWMPSTMANIIDLLMDYEHTVKINENISLLYIGYQIILLIGTVIGPGTIFLMLVGAFVAAFGLDQWSSFYWNLAPIAVFVLVCATCNADVQLFFAGLISAIYGLIMMAVFVGVMLQISQDGFLAPSSLFFFCLAAEFIIAALLHPKEFNCLKYGVVYYVTVPSMYMLLVIYSVFNMNNISWGTRDVTVVPKPAADAEKKEEEEKPEKKDKILSFLGANTDDNQGTWEFSVNRLFKIMCCTYKEDKPETETLKKIQEAIGQLDKKIDHLEKMTYSYSEPELVNTGTTFMEGSKGTLRNRNTPAVKEDADNISTPSEEVMENSWFYDGGLIRGEVHYLDKKEETFWRELLEKYLYPFEDDQKQLGKDLKDLRDKMVFTFFMLNSLFVLVIFLLTLKKDFLHLNWPIDPKTNFTYYSSKNEVYVYVTYLELEPIGFVFLIFFALLMVVQFVAMLIHRFGTFSQILTQTKIDFNLFERKAQDMTAEELRNTDPLKIVKDLQRLRGTNDEDEDIELVPVEHRKTTIRPSGNRRPTSAPTLYLEDAFHLRVQQLGNLEGSDNRQSRIVEDRKKSVAFVQQRMSKARISRAAPVMQRRSVYSNPTTNNDLFLDDSLVIRDMDDFSDSGA